MLPLRAEIRTDVPIADARSAARRTLRLEVPAYSSADATKALIHNLSETGLLVETAADLQVGEALQIDLPHAGPTTALVIRRSGAFIGCEFAAPVSKAAVSAALLRNPIDRVPAPPAPAAFADGLLHEELEPSNQTILIVSLLVSLLVALAIVVAFLRFPFSA